MIAFKDILIGLFLVSRALPSYAAEESDSDDDFAFVNDEDSKIDKLYIKVLKEASREQSNLKPLEEIEIEANNGNKYAIDMMRELHNLFNQFDSLDPPFQPPFVDGKKSGTKINLKLNEWVTKQKRSMLIIEDYMKGTVETEQEEQSSNNSLPPSIQSNSFFSKYFNFQ